MVGFLSALLVLFLAIGLLPQGHRKRARQGAVLLGLSLACFLAWASVPQDSSARRLLLFGATFFLLASIGRSLVVLLIEVRAARRTARPAPRIFRDLSTAAVYLAVALLALRAIDVEPGSILTTSALLTAVVGLAMQDTLGNLVSGLALQLQRPFDVGDWVEIDGGQQAGRIAEVTWRATTIMTLDHVEVILPNAGLAKASIRNYSRPSPVARRRVIVSASLASAPASVHEVLIGSVTEVSGVLATPAPSARTRSFGESAIEYEVLFYIDDFERALVIEGGVRDRIYYAFARSGIEMPFPTRTLVLAPQDAGARREATRRRCAAAIGWVPLLQPLPLDAREVLAARASLKTYGPGEAVVRKGQASLELFSSREGRWWSNFRTTAARPSWHASGQASASGRWGFSPASHGPPRFVPSPCATSWSSIGSRSIKCLPPTPRSSTVGPSCRERQAGSAQLRLAGRPHPRRSGRGDSSARYASSSSWSEHPSPDLAPVGPSRTTRTEQEAWFTTLPAVVPSRRLTPEYPCDPMTMRSACRVRAVSQIDCQGAPRTTSVPPRTSAGTCVSHSER